MAARLLYLRQSFDSLLEDPVLCSPCDRLRQRVVQTGDYRSRSDVGLRIHVRHYVTLVSHLRGHTSRKHHLPSVRLIGFVPDAAGLVAHDLNRMTSCVLDSRAFLLSH